MPTFIPNPSFVIKESHYLYLIPHYIHTTHHTFIPNQNRPSRNNKYPKTQHCLAQHLAQAEESRSGETISLRRVLLRLSEGSKRNKRAMRDLA